jgi:hypothetical protein
VTGAVVAIAHLIRLPVALIMVWASGATLVAAEAMAASMAAREAWR